MCFTWSFAQTTQNRARILVPNFGRSRARLCPFSFAPCPFPNLAGTLTIYVNDNANQNNTPEQNVDITVQPIRNRIGSHKRTLHTPPHPLPPQTPHLTLYPLTPTNRLSPRLAWQSLPWIFFSPDVSSDLCPSSTSASSRSHPIGRWRPVTSPIPGGCVPAGSTAKQHSKTSWRFKDLNRRKQLMTASEIQRQKRMYGCRLLGLGTWGEG